MRERLLTDHERCNTADKLRPAASVPGEVTTIRREAEISLDASSISGTSRGKDEQASLEERLRRLPKAELHVHLDGSLRPETMLELAAAEGIAMPAADATALREFMHVRDARDLVDYLERFRITLSVLQTEESLERAAYELAEDLAAEGVRYAEIRYSPILNTSGGLALEKTVEAPLRGLRRAREAFGIRTGVIVCAIRSMDPSISRMLAELAVAYGDRGVVGFDLAGPEAGYPPGAHMAAFDLARASGLGLTIHAGEAAGPESIREAVECGACRIGHGTRLHEDPELMERIRDGGIHLEICLTSNVQTRAAADFPSHPARRYFDFGIPISLNTDNRLMSATTVTREYHLAHEHQGFRWNELVRVAAMSFEAAFLPEAERGVLLAELDRECGSV